MVLSPPFTESTTETSIRRSGAIGTGDQDFWIREGVDTLAKDMGDLNGIMRGKRIPDTHWETVWASGNALPIVLLAIDMTVDVGDTPYLDFDNGYPDMHLFPEPWRNVSSCITALAKDSDVLERTWRHGG